MDLGKIMDSKAWQVGLPILEAILILVVGYFAIKLVLRGVKKLLERTKQVDSMLHTFILHAVEIFLWVVIILSALNKLGIDSTSVVTVLAACGAAVALALQGSLSNLAGGILIMISQPFSSGDYICTCGVEGTVESIDLLHTTIVTADRRLVTIPNGSLTGNVIVNNTKEGTRRVDIEVGISYNSDLDTARYILSGMAKRESRVLEEPSPVCVVTEYADSAVILSLRCFCKSTDYWDVKFALQNEMKAELEKAGIEIPFPQVDVHMQNN